jgi:formate dehydrogenase major subunit
MHIQHRVGTDIALLNGWMRIILEKGWENRDFIEKYTEGIEDLEAVVREYPLDRVSRITGVPVDQIYESARILGTGGPVSLCYTLGITEHTCGTDNVRSVANLQLLLGNLGKSSVGVNPLRGQNNVQGACDMGALPDVYHNYQKVDDPQVALKFEQAWKKKGLSQKKGYKLPTMLQGMLDGRTRALICLGENPVMSEPNIAHTRKCFQNLEFLMVADIFPNDTSEYADLVFPCRSWGQKDGTYTNSERRVQRIRKAVEPTGGTREAWWIFNQIGKRMGFDMGLSGPEQIWDEMRSLATSYSGITWDRLEKEGLQWPVPESDHPGTPYLFKGGRFKRGKALFIPAQHQAPAEEPDQEYPFVLTTGRRLWHYHTGTQTRNCKGFEDLFPEELVEISIEDAGKLGIENNDLVEIISRRGQVRMRAWVSKRSPQGILWSCFHFREASINEVTNNVFDPLTETAEYKACAVRLEKL